MPYDPLTGGYQPLPKVEIHHKWAWFPRKSSTGKWLWFEKYIMKLERFWGPASISPYIEKTIFSEKQWLLELMQNPNGYEKREPSLPKGRSGVPQKQSQ